MRRHRVLWVIIFILMVFAVPALALAGDTGVVTIDNPLGVENSDPRVVIGRVIGGVLGIIGSLALAIFVYGGVTWMTSGGNQDRIRKGKDMIIWAVLGIAIIFLSYAIVTFIITVFLRGNEAQTIDQPEQEIELPAE